MISLEDASLTKKGIVKLSSATDSDSEALAATPKAVKTVMGEVRTKAPLDSPAFTGTPTTPTPPGDAKGLQTTNAEFVRKLIAAHWSHWTPCRNWLTRWEMIRTLPPRY